MEGRFVYGDDIYVPDYYMDEEWAYSEIPGYMISNKGRMWSESSQKFLKLLPIDKHGHLGYKMSHNGKHYYKYVHRLMATAFIPNPFNYPIVRHLDDDPSNNELDNLAWGTMKDNSRDCLENGHAYYLTSDDREIGLKISRKPVIATDIRTGKEKRYPSTAEAARQLDLQTSNIGKVLYGKRQHTCGYSFRFSRKEDRENAKHN